MAANELTPEELRKQKRCEYERKRVARRRAENAAAFREKRKAADKKWREANPKNALESDRKKDKKWQSANPEKVKARNKNRDPEAQRTRSRAYYAAHAEEQRAASRAYRKANPDKVSASNKKWHEENRERVREAYVRYRERNAERLREYHRSPARKAALKASSIQYARNPANRMKVLVASAKCRAKKLGLQCDGLAELRARVVPTDCACCNQPLDYGRKGIKKPGLRSPTLDRHNTTLGYVTGNVRVICWRCNRLKSDASVEEVEAILAYMRS